MTLSTETVLRVLKVSSFEYCDKIWWRQVDDEPLRMFVMCSDVFHWATSDAEEITDDNIDSLEQTIAEVQEIVGKWDAFEAFILWVSRVRKLRPQGAYLKGTDERLIPLFEAAGPERSVEIGNPVAYPEVATSE